MVAKFTCDGLIAFKILFYIVSNIIQLQSSSPIVQPATHIPQVVFPIQTVTYPKTLQLDDQIGTASTNLYVLDVGQYHLTLC